MNFHLIISDRLLSPKEWGVRLLSPNFEACGCAGKVNFSGVDISDSFFGSGVFGILIDSPLTKSLFVENFEACGGFVASKVKVSNVLSESFFISGVLGI